MKNFFHLLVINIITFLYCASIVLTMDPELCAALFDATVWQYTKYRIVLIWKQMLHVRRSFFWPRKKKNTHVTDIVIINGPYQTPDQPSEKQENQEKFHPPAITKRSQVATLDHPNSDAPISIAAVSFTNTLYVKRMMAGFSTYCQKTLGETYDLKYYSAHKDELKMGQIIDHVNNNHHTLIFTIGATATKRLKVEYEVRNLHTPVVFTAVKEPHKLGIIDDYEKPGGLFTGITGIGHNYKEQLDYLFAAKQTINRILIPCTKYSTYVEEDMELIQKVAKDRGVCVDYIEYKNQKEFDKYVLGAFKQQNVDTVITLRDLPPKHLLDSLVAHANHYGKTVYASDVPSLSQGVGIAYGNHEEPFGSIAGKHACEILVKGRHPSEIPTAQIKSEKVFWINPKVAEQQGIKNAHAIVSFMQKGKVFTNEYE